jgi:N-acylneuraminate cytidylyltransferase
MVKKLVAFIPARAGSKRVPGKNTRDFFGHPLIAYAIQSAYDAGIFDGIYVTSDSWDICKIATSYGACYIERPAEFARDDSPDSEWIEHAKSVLEPFDYFAIVRPTNPFRTGETVKRAWELWDKYSIMKAIEPVKQHPGKMWRLRNHRVMESYSGGGQHLEPLQNLEKLFIQNASLEFRATMPGRTYQPFFTEGHEGFDINTETDWILAEELVKRELAKLLEIRRPSI